MKVYEFWLKEESKEIDLDDLIDIFFTGRRKNISSMSRNPRTNWVQITVIDNTHPSMLRDIETEIDALRDDESPRKYDDDDERLMPIESPKHFALDRVLRVRQKQKDRTLGRIKDVI